MRVQIIFLKTIRQKLSFMYICVCKGVTERDIREAVRQGAVRMRDLRSCLGVTGQCGTCACYAKSALDKALLQELPQQTVVSPS
ncbi:hypothetical protein Nstercoris_01968 [Nitrosomonas stercoris]|uniref:Bacterioferritin-associated ferredoxin n=1 Tax=Nitrosomonas stercoris TaxID=1444684 RepID=A0A4Y1YRP5_9PROT|nr:hypothetical protein Nstercoris_01968 [Nitrosomonas stercoris]